MTFWFIECTNTNPSCGPPCFPATYGQALGKILTDIAPKLLPRDDWVVFCWVSEIKLQPGVCRALWLSSDGFCAESVSCRGIGGYSVKGLEDAIQLRLREAAAVSGGSTEDLKIVTIHLKNFQIDVLRFSRITDWEPTFVRQLERKRACLETHRKGNCLHR
jgi:hypothetical protein